MKSKIPREFALLLNRPIKTQRLLLESLVAAHADILFDPLCDERIYRWIESGGPKDLSELRSKWQRNEARLSPDGKEAWLNWAIRLAKEGSYIGKLDAELDSPINVTNVGFVLFPKYWGYDYATEALMGAKTVLAAHGITRMRATVSTPNIASVRVLEKAGFTRGNLVTDEIDTYEYNIAMHEDLNVVSQQGDSPEDCAPGDR
jgi:ribosomal-protein-alanine N-acetyltransferase